MMTLSVFNSFIHKLGGSLKGLLNALDQSPL